MMLRMKIDHGDQIRMILDKNDLKKFLTDYPLMSLTPFKGESIIFKGNFCFIAQSKSRPKINDSFSLKIEIPKTFPKEIPKVWETAKRIPRTSDGEYHINPNDSLCLGSPLRLLNKISHNPSLVGFTKTCLVPFLYAVSLKLQNGGNFYMGELAHGSPGVMDDYKDLFGVNDNKSIIKILELMGTKKRVANKSLCPCLCDKRLGKCRLRFIVNSLRKATSRNWFKEHAKALDSNP